MSAPFRAPKGLAGVSVADSAIAKSEPDGTLVYRGYAIEELAEHAGFEETAYLVLNGRLPRREELRAFEEGLAAQMPLPEKVLEIMSGLPKGSHPLDVMMTATSALGSLEESRTHAEQMESVEAKMGPLAANCQRLPSGQAPVRPKRGVGFAAGLLQTLTGQEHTELEAWVFERVLMFYVEHDLNASSFTVRVVASTLADPFAAATAGIASLSGPLHGGANEAAMRMLLELKDPGAAAPFVAKEFAAGRKVTGFGHRVYKKFDPRARLCKGYLGELLRAKGDDGLLRLCDALETEMWKRKEIPPNLDFYAAPIFYTLGIPIPLYTPVFAASRVFGWMAHYAEQVADNRIIRPDATYTGPTGLKYVKIGER
jgi:2-methylcitrate synthase